ncbi:MAG: type I DNA topoisomerase [Patescibacteria group bacterium]|nr:type I DNA topoisomerase [Patescibacteria group bacterium]
MDLIIVESPTKAKTISKFLPKDYKVESSFGHIRDLPVKELGVDIENNFEPHYVIPAKAKKTIANLKSLTKKANKVILASDEDREGEAIAWHLSQALSLKNKSNRIVFHEITKDAILEALSNPRDINSNMVDAQQARRVLDRLVGYKLSPFLWKKVTKGLSAGRVQSVAIRIIVEREREIQKFISEEYWTISADLKTLNGDIFISNLIKKNDKTLGKLELKESTAKQIEKDLKSALFKIIKIEQKESKKNPLPPFITSTLQQTANRYLGYSAKQTMTLAQKLYEKGYITYMRTDSLNLSSKFTNAANYWITNNLGKEYNGNKNSFINKNKNAQEAHEAIRPTEVEKTPEIIGEKLESGESRLYKLIWQRALASQMASAKINSTTIDTIAQGKDNYLFRANGQVIVFPGYLKIWPEKTKEQNLPVVQRDEKLELIKITTDKHETVPPARYSDAGLIKQMEKHGIGRPSTYAPTINTVITRNYVERDDSKRLKPTEIAFVVNDLLVLHFPQIVDYHFTAEMETGLDMVASGNKKWQPLISEFYQDFADNLENKYKEIKKEEIMPIEESNEKCDKCGAPMIIKTGRYGKFLACSAYPKCKNIKSLNKKEEAQKEVSPQIKALEEKYKDQVCDKCGALMKVKVGKYGPFLACSAYPKCKNIKNISDNNVEPVTCPICQQGKIVKKISRRGVFYACDNYPQCKNAYQGEPSGKTCKKCGALMIFTKAGKEKCSNKDCK